MRSIFSSALVIALCLLAPQALAADLPTYEIVKNKSFLKFNAIQNDAPIEGKFTDFTAEIHFDPDHLQDSSVKVEVNLGSVVVQSPDVLQNIKAPDWLSVEAFPKATFLCKKFTRMPASNNYYADCQLTLRGKTVPVVLNFQMEHFDSKGAVVTGYVSLHRLDFGIGQGEWSHDDVVKDEVHVEFRVAAERK